MGQLSRRGVPVAIALGMLLGSTTLPPAAEHPVFSVSAWAQARAQRRIAVLDFDFSSVSSPNLLNAYPGLSRGVSDILVDRLVKNGTFRLIERSRIEAVMREQNFGASGRVDAATAAEIGKILGVDAVVIGSVTRLDIQNRQSGFGGAILPFGLGVATTDVDAYVQLNVRLVNTTTAEIVAVAEGTGNTSQSDSAVAAFGFGGGAAGGAATSNTEKLIFLATAQAVDRVTEQLVASAPKVAAAVRVANPAVVADVTGNTITLNQGRNAGYQVGNTVTIERVSREVKDPATGKVLRRVTQPVGQIQLTEVTDTYSVGRMVSGTRILVGDTAKPAN
ncbi:MAG: CsgG/HfaB family protein [Pseudanabaenaceae cyanobacterium]